MRTIAASVLGGSAENGRCGFVMPSSDVIVEAAFKAESLQRNPFTNVPDGAYYTNAALWAIDHGITTGVSASSFDPHGICTRAAQIVTFLCARWLHSHSIKSRSA